LATFLPSVSVSEATPAPTTGLALLAPSSPLALEPLIIGKGLWILFFGDTKMLYWEQKSFRLKFRFRIRKIHEHAKKKIA